MAATASSAIYNPDRSRSDNAIEFARHPPTDIPFGLCNGFVQTKNGFVESKAAVEKKYDSPPLPAASRGPTSANIGWPLMSCPTS
jgi:hypothetical protein